MLNDSIKKARKKIGLSINELANKTHLSSSYLYQIERGDKDPSFNTVKEIAKALNISYFDLINENFVFNKDTIKSISTSKSKKFADEVQNEVNKANAMAESVKNLLEYLGFEVVENEDKYGVLNNVYLAYKNISCNLDDEGYYKMQQDIYKSIKGMAFNYIIKDK